MFWKFFIKFRRDLLLTVPLYLVHLQLKVLVFTKEATLPFIFILSRDICKL